MNRDRYLSPVPPDSPGGRRLSLSMPRKSGPKRRSTRAGSLGSQVAARLRTMAQTARGAMSMRAAAEAPQKGDEELDSPDRRPPSRVRADTVNSSELSPKSPRSPGSPGCRSFKIKVQGVNAFSV